MLAIDETYYQISTCDIRQDGSHAVSFVHKLQTNKKHMQQTNKRIEKNKGEKYYEPVQI